MKNLKRISRVMMTGSAAEAALASAEIGIPILAVWGVDDGACLCGKKQCESPGKHPIGHVFTHGHKDATTDAQKIRKVFREFPDANLAIVPQRDLFVFDVDGEKGKAAYRKLGLPVTASVVTSRGRHHYFSVDSALSIDRLPEFDGIDLRTNGNGYVVVPPSTHASGSLYRWKDSTRALSSLPSSLTGSHSVKVDFSNTRLNAVQGRRNSTLTSFAGYLRYRGLDVQAITAVLNAINDKVCCPPLERPEVRRIAHSIGRYATEHNEAFGTLEDVAEEDIEWLAKPYFPLGAATVLDGNPGQGKSTFVMALAAAVTSGRKPPFLPDLRMGNVLLLSAEDDAARVLKPRLIASGAETSKVRFQKAAFSLDEHGLALLRAEIELCRPVLVVIDPLIAYVGAGVDFNKANEMTHFMTEVDMLAREFNTSILIVRHLRKAEADDPLHRGLGSIAISARVRSLLVLGRHPDEPDLRVIAHAKCSWAKEGAAFVFEIVAKSTDKAPKVQWRGLDPDLTAERLLSRPNGERGRPDNEREEAKTFLRGFLNDGPKAKSAIERAADARSMSTMTLRRAASDLRVQKLKEGNVAMWKFPAK